jgi:deoxyribonucleoside regulator
VLDLWERLEVAVFGVGGRAWTAASVGDDVATALDRQRAVGEVLVAPFDLDGRWVGRDALRERTIAFDAPELGRVPQAIAIAGGAAKVAPILGALRAGLVGSLVTDVATARAVVALDDETREPPMPEVGP